MATGTSPAPRRRGRPRKFAGPSRAVTLTLPEETLRRLAALDGDVSHAIVRLADTHKGSARKAPAELAAFGRRAVITIRPTASLERRVGIDLVPLPDGRALISFEQPKTVADWEVMLNDAIEDRALSPDDRHVFESIRENLKAARRSNDVRLLRRSINVLEYGGRAVSERGAATAVRDRSRVRS